MRVYDVFGLMLLSLALSRSFALSDSAALAFLADCLLPPVVRARALSLSISLSLYLSLLVPLVYCFILL